MGDSGVIGMAGGGERVCAGGGVGDGCCKPGDEFARDGGNVVIWTLLWTLSTAMSIKFRAIGQSIKAYTGSA